MSYSINSNVEKCWAYKKKCISTKQIVDTKLDENNCTVHGGISSIEKINK